MKNSVAILLIYLFSLILDHIKHPAKQDQNKANLFIFLTCTLYGHTLFSLSPILCHTWDVPTLISNSFWLTLNMLLILSIGILVETVGLHCLYFSTFSHHMSVFCSLVILCILSIWKRTISKFQLLI